MPRQSNAAFQRGVERAIDLLRSDASLSDREIARRTGVSHPAIAARRKQLEASGEIARRVAAERMEAQEHGGTLTRSVAGRPSARLSHGCKSMNRLQPRADQLTVELRSAVPGAVAADDTAIRLLALMLARIEAATAWLDQRGLFRSAKRGEPWPIIKNLSAWENSAARLCDQLGLTPTARARLGVHKSSEDGYAAYLRLVERGGADGRVEAEHQAAAVRR